MKCHPVSVSSSLLWPVCTFIHHVIMCRPWIRQLLAKADPVIATGLGSKITAVWSSCYQHSACPQWPACVRSGVGELGSQRLSPSSRPAIASAVHSCAAESWRTVCVRTGLRGRVGLKCVFVFPQYTSNIFTSVVRSIAAFTVWDRRPDPFCPIPNHAVRYFHHSSCSTGSTTKWQNTTSKKKSRVGEKSLPPSNNMVSKMSISDQ